MYIYSVQYSNNFFYTGEIHQNLSNVRLPLCTICYDAPANTLVLPCMHHATCAECIQLHIANSVAGGIDEVNNTARCIVCREEIVQVAPLRYL